MKKRLIVFVFGVLAFTATSVLAQTENSAPKKGEIYKIGSIDKGVVNGIAVNLVKPAYPPAAKAVRAEGSVSVQVTINEEGNVISAEAISGHPLLRNASAQAALQSKFKPTLLQGQAVKVVGVIVYNFVADTSGSSFQAPTWFNAGRSLASLEKGASLRFSYPVSLNNLMPNDWALERNYLQTLDELRNAEIEAAKISPDKNNEEVVEKIVTQPDGTQKTVKVVQSKITIATKPSPEQISTAQSLISALQSRLSVNQTDLWNFNLGVKLSQILSSGKNDGELNRKTEDLRLLVQSAPSETSPELIAELNKFISVAEKIWTFPADKSELATILFNINRLQSIKK